VVRLHERLVEMRQLESQNDYVEIANFAHWLKGSAGSMGYDVFMAPAVQLETAAKAAESERVAQILGELREMAQHVVAPQETSAVA